MMQTNLAGEYVFSLCEVVVGQTTYDIDHLNKLSSSYLLWQQTSARLYGTIEQATDKLGRSQHTDTNNLLAVFWCHCSCQPHDTKRF